jgi:predicted ATPase/DNA-binding CsgD family transcriptional regulator
VYFVALASVTDPDLVPSAVAQALDVRETAGRLMTMSLADALRPKEVLLVLDNFEHIVAAAPFVAALLTSSPRVKVMVTSRSVLRVYGEREISIPPLALPDHRTAPTAAHLAQFEAIHLFVDRAQAARSDFVLTNEDAPAVAEICQRLDGLPLAIELAAARVRALPPRAMLQRMERRLPLLTGGARDLPARQRTLRDAITWSYDLLEPDEQALFRRLAVFRGCTLEAAEQVCAGMLPQPGARATDLPPLDLDILDGIESLVEKSLLRQVQASDGQPWFLMLETVREYALERLEESGEGDTVRRRQVLASLAFIEAAEPELYGAEQARWYARVEEEHDNLRAALAWSEERGFAQPALRMAVALWWFWSTHGYVDEGRSRLASLLGRFPLKPGAPVPRSDLHASVLYSAGILASMQGDHDAACQWLAASLALRRAIGDQNGVFHALEGLGTVLGRQGDHAAARAYLEEALAVARSIGHYLAYALALHALGNISAELGELDTARAYFEEARALVPEDDEHQGPTLSLATIALGQGRLDDAESIALEALTRYRQFGNRHVEALVLVTLGGISLARGNLAESRSRLTDGLAIMEELGRALGIAQTLERFVSLAVAQGHFAGAVQIAGSVTVLHERAGAPLPASGQARLERALEPARRALTGDAAAAAWQAGRGLDVAQAVQVALTITVMEHNTPPGADDPQPMPVGPSILSRREVEVARLIAQGKTNREIAEALVITEGTAANHVNHILTKLGFTSRAQIAVWVSKQGPATTARENGRPRT